MNNLSQRLFYKEVGESNLRGKACHTGQVGVSEDIERFEKRASRKKKIIVCNYQRDNNY